ncbi:hypothetical protein BN77_p11235 [Rhizobium mesoamericanum STM3625]|uniref:Uncharacterized protein n=1 Tax=Rhizobium mesoamericanum STM3625 TaxID=1211777 RepID=K0PPL4_9HYPH|nr:hypothetical protein BN77_p11235 [Rhizobium mesoamericanum STM3625]
MQSGHCSATRASRLSAYAPAFLYTYDHMALIVALSLALQLQLLCIMSRLRRGQGAHNE